MNQKMLLTLFVANFVAATRGVETSIEFKRATPTEHRSTLRLIDKHAADDAADRLVILPEMFRENSLHHTIEQQRLFVAQDSDKVVGFKKMFILNNPQETIETLRDEIRCIDTMPVATGTLAKSVFSQTDAFSRLDLNRTVFVYNGSDYTHPKYRGLGINKGLTDCALDAHLAAIKTKREEQTIKHIALVYGLVKANAGDFIGAPNDRTVSIAKSFEQFIQKLDPQSTDLTFDYARFAAFKPSFDPKGTICQPLPDAHAIPGYGCILRYSFKE